MTSLSQSRILSFLIAAALTSGAGLHCIDKFAPRVLADIDPSVNEPVPVISGGEYFSTWGDTGSGDHAVRLSLIEKLAAMPDAAIPDLVAAAYAASTDARWLDFPTLAGLVRWAELDAPAAFAWVGGLESEAQRSAGYREIGMVWAHNDPTAYGAWLRAELEGLKLPDDGVGSNRPPGYIGHGLDHLGRHDLPGAIRIAASGGFTHAFRSSMRLLSTVEECRAVAAAIDETAGSHQMVQHGGGSDGARRSFSSSGFDMRRLNLAVQWQRLDPEDYRVAVAAGEFGSVMRTGEYGREFEPEKAIRELERTVGEAERRETMFSIVERWAVADLDAAGEWLGAQGDAAETWPARRCFARLAARDDPHAALVWLETIGDESIRRAGFVDIVEVWVGKHPDASPDMSGWSAQRRRDWDELSAVVAR